MVRNNNGIRAELNRGSGVFDVENAFDDDLARPDFLDPLDVFPVQRGIELLIRPLRQRCDVLHALHVAGEISEILALASEDAEGPGGLGGDVDDVPQANLRRHRHAVAKVAMALAEDLKIDGEHERIAIRGDGARQNIAREGTIANDVKLK